jgi:hypothetical protein
MQKEEILAEIRRTAAENGGKPLGVDRFASVTGIKTYDWGRFWARFGDAQREAGFEPNQKMIAHDEDFLMRSIIEFIRELKGFPTRGEMRLRRFKDTNFPPDTVYYRRFGGKNELIIKIISYCNEHAEYQDVIDILEPLVETNGDGIPSESSEQALNTGFVYLVKGHPGEYKIGRTNLVDRRLSELGATASVEQTLIHEIKTDDPAGIESYWHRRFQDKRMKGEWFRLSPADVKTFKRWRRIY